MLNGERKSIDQMKINLITVNTVLSVFHLMVEINIFEILSTVDFHLHSIHSLGVFYLVA